ncbi:uncharacterized protein LOC125614950 [Marmota marmota marmota]|uniref:uncharacterized protein LOC125614950 n=1 Tax=Marmota marmota marmota TaxID=9994 RepID=UPI00209235E4|nr:uncharacterized protein LOC125614950 [Marmota marmota marmota]
MWPAMHRLSPSGPHRQSLLTMGLWWCPWLQAGSLVLVREAGPGGRWGAQGCVGDPAAAVCASHHLGPGVSDGFAGPIKEECLLPGAEPAPPCPGWAPPTPSPTDCLLMLAYKDKSDRAKGLRERSSLTLEDICGLEPGLPYEGLVHTLAIVCLSQAVMLGFDSRQAMCAWDARIRYALGEGECPDGGPGEGFPHSTGALSHVDCRGRQDPELHTNEGKLVDTSNVVLLGLELCALDEGSRRARPCLGVIRPRIRVGSMGAAGFVSSLAQLHWSKLPPIISQSPALASSWAM